MRGVQLKQFIATIAAAWACSVGVADALTLTLSGEWHWGI